MHFCIIENSFNVDGIDRCTLTEHHDEKDRIYQYCLQEAGSYPKLFRDRRALTANAVFMIRYALSITSQRAVPPQLK